MKKEKLRILIVDDDRRLARTLVDILRLKGYEAEASYSGRQVLDMVKKEGFDCVLTDIKTPGINGVELYKAIKEVQPGLPVVLMTAYPADRLVKEGEEAGAIATVTKPLNINSLLCFFSSLQKERPIVIVDDDAEFARMLGDILQMRGFGVTKTTDPHAAGEMLSSDAQAVVLDMKLNSTNGLDILKEIRGKHPHLPVILVTGYREEMASAIEAAMKINAYTCLYKPVEIEGLLQVLAEVRQRELKRILGQPSRMKGAG